jgi:carbon-monoxide dehydrogenase medium subunit|tara:strand:- start:6471 stop:7301 length:831 start_codon:yes stop_codon:yes gene_type:complete
MRVKSLEEAFDLLEEYGEDARILSGGQSLMPTLNMRLSAPKILIDINQISGLSDIEIKNDKVRVGSLVRHNHLSSSDIVTKHLPLVSKAVPHIAHHAIRNRGTIGGSIAFADPAAELPAVAKAAGFTFIIKNRNEEREVEAEDFFLGLFETSLKETEILIAIEAPKLQQNEKTAFIELSRRQGDYAIIGVAAQSVVENSVFKDIRLAYFGAGDKPVMAKQAIDLLEGQSYSEEVVSEAQKALEADLNPMDDLNGPPEMKMHLARVITARALADLIS